MSKTRIAIILAGAAVVLVGLAWPWLLRLPLGRLPGDIALDRGRFKFYFPVVTCLLGSLLLTLLFQLARWLGK